MLVIGDDEKRRQRAQTPGALGVAGGAGPSAALPLLADALAWTASVRLASGPTAPATRPAGLSPRAASRHFSPMGPEKAALFGIKRFE